MTTTTELSTDTLVKRLRYQGEQYSNGSASRGGSVEVHYLIQAANKITELEAQLSDWKALHAAIATGQPIWPNNWSQEVAMLAYEFDVKNAQIDAAKNDVELGAAIMRACRDLPMNFTLEVNLERGNSNVILFDTGFTDITPNLGDMTFAKKVNGCIDAAIQAGEVEL